jgi:cysteinylglycine-S-conjugate dipeptidase
VSHAWIHEDAWLERVARWIALHPVTGSAAAQRLASEIVPELESLGFVVEVRGSGGRSPLIVARRAPAGNGLTVGIYGHYDVEPAAGVWRGEPRRLRRESDRVFGRGIADNLGPLAARLLAVRDVRQWPGVLWVLEGEEETGSARLAENIDALGAVDVALWLDETGYFEASQRQRILAFGRDARLDALCALWRGLAAEESVSVTFEPRMLNRAATASAGPVGRLFAGKPYAAFGPNDGAANVHAAEESLPLGTLALTARQLVAMLDRLGAEQVT